MIVCVCKAVSDKHIRRAVQDGEVLNLRDLTRELGLGTCCGKCVPVARQVLSGALERACGPLAAPLAPGPFAAAQRA